MAAEFQGLGFDPAPGSPDAVASAVARLADVAERAGAAELDLRHVRDLPAGWAGDAAEGFTGRLTGIPDSLAATRAELLAAKQILEDWLERLGAARRVAEELDRKAAGIRTRITEARDTVERLTTEAQFRAGAGQELADARGALASSTEELEQLLDRARNLRHDHLAEASRVAGLLRAIPGGAASASAPAGEAFAPARDALDRFSALGHQITSVLTPLGSTDSVSAPPGAAGAFAAAVSGAPGADPFDGGR